MHFQEPKDAEMLGVCVQVCIAMKTRNYLRNFLRAFESLNFEF